MPGPPVVERLIRLFGPQWQAALDHARVLSRRRAREIGAGAEPTPLMLATIELLETCPRAHWPERWRRLAYRFPGKTSDTCPTIEVFGNRLHPDGRIDPVDVVFVWDNLQEGGFHYNVDVAVGMLPAALYSRPPTDPIHVRWTRWNEQWDSAHGGAMLSDWLEVDGATPEGVLAGWIARGLLRRQDVAKTLEEAERRIFGFDRDRLRRLERQLREKFSSGAAESPAEPISAIPGQTRTPERAGRRDASRD